jgi:hypothetical protein
MTSPKESTRRRKPSKKNRNQQDTVPQEPQNKKEKKTSIDDPRQRLRDKIKSMQKDRAKGSYACEENANHEF